MKVLLVTDFSIYQQNQRIYTKFAFSSIIKRYYNRFGKISFCCPLKSSQRPAGCDVEITDMVEEITPLTNWDGLLHRKSRAVRKAVEKQAYTTAGRRCHLFRRRTPYAEEFSLCLPEKAPGTIAHRHPDLRLLRRSGLFARALAQRLFPV